MFNVKIPTHQFLASLRAEADVQLQARVEKAATVKKAEQAPTLSATDWETVQELIAERMAAKKAKHEEANATAAAAKAK